MSRRDAIHRVASRSARLCKKNEKTAIGMIVTTIAARAMRVVALPFRAPAAFRRGSFDFVVNDTNPELSPIHPSPGKGTRDVGQEYPHE